MASYMLPRLVFRGQFLAAPSTPNNWAKTFQNTPADWTENAEGSQLGKNNWNPFGGADVRFPTSRLVDAVTEPGTAWDGKGPKLVIETDYGRSVAKICDQDPMMQMMSRIFGLNMVIKNADTGEVYLQGHMHQTAFTDLTIGNFGPRARYTSAVKFAQINEPEAGNAALTQLYQLAGDPTETLGLTMMVGAHFHSDQSAEWANNGTGTFVIGPLSDQLEGFDNHQEVFQRRILPSEQDDNGQVELSTTYVALKDNVLTVDMINALNLTSQQLSKMATPQTAPDVRFQEASIGAITIAALNSDADIIFNDTEIAFSKPNASAILMRDEKISAEQFISLGTVDFTHAPSDADSLIETNGLIFDFTLSDQQASAAKSQPLAILAKEGDGYVIKSRETLAGINIAYTGGRAIATIGMEPGNDMAKTRVSVRQYSEVLDPSKYAAQLSVAPLKKAVNTANDGGAFSKAGGKVAFPENALTPSFSDDALMFSVRKEKEIASPRKTTSKGYTEIGGQLYQFNVEPNVSEAVLTVANDFIAQMVTQEQGQMDFICVLAMDTGSPKANPDFDTDVKPIMQQYANLYPVMSRYLFNLADEAQLQKNATILYFAFTASQTSGHYMPVTRDMPQWQRQTICNWLKTFMSEEQIGRMDAHAVAEVVPDLVSTRSASETSEILLSLSEHLGSTQTELADLLVQMGVPVNEDLEEILQIHGGEIVPKLMRLRKRALSKMRGDSGEDDEPKNARMIPARRVDVKAALKASFGDMDEAYAKQFSKAGVIYNVMHSKT